VKTSKNQVFVETFSALKLNSIVFFETLKNPPCQGNRKKEPSLTERKPHGVNVKATKGKRFFGKENGFL